MPSYDHALVVGKFAPLHRGHQALLDHASAIAGRLTVVVWSNPDLPAMPNETRAGWVRELYPAATVLVGADGPANDAPDDEQHAYVARLLDRHGPRPDVVCTNEAYGPAFAASLGAEHIGVPGGRTTSPASGTAVRADVHGQRHLLDPRVYRHFVERVVFLGAESTGKSTLAARMAGELATVHVPEYGREHYERKGGRLTLDDYVEIAVTHRRHEDEAILHADRYLFVDTNAVTTMFFSHYYDRDSLPALRLLADECATRYRHHIVCDDDLPFEQDGWRDNALWRARMQGMVLHDLAVRRIPNVVVSGPLDERVAQVLATLRGEHIGTPAAGGRGNLGPAPARDGSSTAIAAPSRSGRDAYLGGNRFGIRDDCRPEADLGRIPPRWWGQRQRRSRRPLARAIGRAMAVRMLGSEPTTIRCPRPGDGGVQQLAGQDRRRRLGEHDGDGVELGALALVDRHRVDGVDGGDAAGADLDQLCRRARTRRRPDPVVACGR